MLDRDDNPYLIFESLNATGQPLTQADLIRNFVFMRVHAKHQDKVFRECWQPMQERLGKHLTEFMRHFLMRDGRVIKQGDVYFSFKECVEERDEEDIQGYLTEIASFSVNYSRLIDPSLDPSVELSQRLARLNRIEATTAYPFLLNVYHDYAAGRLRLDDVSDILDILEAFLIRRYVCGIPTNSLSKIFVSLYAQAQTANSLKEGVKAVLSDRGFPRDKNFRDQFVTLQVYGGGDRRDKAKLILDRLEASFEHKESIDTTTLSIEHVMPQTLTDWWKEHLGDVWQETYESWLDTIGNLTLTGYNPELSNFDFTKKRAILNASHIELNRYFGNIDRWDDDAIRKRGEELAERAIRIWPDVATTAKEQEDPVEAEEEREEFTAILDAVIEDLGGSEAEVGTGRFRIHRLPDGRVVNAKYSRSHVRYYWFGLHTSLWDDIRRANATHMILVLGTAGYAVVPIDIMQKYVAEARTSPKEDGSVRHYHVLVSTGPKPELFHHGVASRYPIYTYIRPLPAKPSQDKNNNDTSST